MLGLCNSLTKASVYDDNIFLSERLDSLILDCKGQLEFAHYFAHPDTAISPFIMLDLPL